MTASLMWIPTFLYPTNDPHANRVPGGGVVNLGLRRTE